MSVMRISTNNDTGNGWVQSSSVPIVYGRPYTEHITLDSTCDTAVSTGGEKLPCSAVQCIELIVYIHAYSAKFQVSV